MKADGLYKRSDDRARHYVDRGVKPPEITCGYAMTWHEHQRRAVRTLDEVTCRKCYDLLLQSGATIRGKRLRRYGEATID